jgi:hypothetical protein
MFPLGNPLETFGKIADTGNIMVLRRPGPSVIVSYPYEGDDDPLPASITVHAHTTWDSYDGLLRRLIATF